jgi:hypothetical protein
MQVCTVKAIIIYYKMLPHVNQVRNDGGDTQWGAGLSCRSEISKLTAIVISAASCCAVCHLCDFKLLFLFSYYYFLYERLTHHIFHNVPYTPKSGCLSTVISWVCFLVWPLKKQWIQVSVQYDRANRGVTSTFRNLLHTRIFSCTIWMHSRFYNTLITIYHKLHTAIISKTIHNF